MPVEQKVIGWEAANSYVKIKSEKKSEAYFNSLWPLPEFGYESDVTGGRRKEELYRIGDTTYRVGDRLDNYQTSSSRNDERYNTSNYRIESLIALVRHSEHGDVLDVVTAVPADHIKSERIHKDIDKQLKGDHTIFVNSKPHVITIKRVRVISQPVATVLSVTFSEDGKLAMPQMNTNRKIVIDIGWGTTDVAIMKGLTVLNQFTVDVSMYDAYRRINDWLKKEHSELETSKFTLFDMEEQLRDDDVFSWGNVEYDCKEIKDRAFRNTADDIMNNLNNRQVNLRDYDLSLFSGGGIEALRNYMTKHTDGVNAKKLDKPQIANAVGCYLYGKYKN